MKKLTVIVMALLLLIGLTACASGKTAKDKKEITIGFDNTFVPMAFKDKDGTNKGFDLDLANAVFAKYDLKVNWQPINWNMKETELKNGNIDLIWNGYSVTDKRKEKVLFSEVYMHSGQVLVTKKSSGIESTEQMKGKTLGVQAASSGYDAFTNQPKVLKDNISGEVSQYANFNEAFLDVKNGRINALLADEPFANYYLTQSGEKDNYNIIPTAYETEGFAVGARKEEQELIDKINSALKELRESGEFKKISEKWFGKEVK